MDHVLSELSTKTRPSWVALHGMTHCFTELDKAVVHVVTKSWTRLSNSTEQMTCAMSCNGPWLDSCLRVCCTILEHKWNWKQHAFEPYCSGVHRWRKDVDLILAGEGRAALGMHDQGRNESCRDGHTRGGGLRGCPGKKQWEAERSSGILPKEGVEASWVSRGLLGVTTKAWPV